MRGYLIFFSTLLPLLLLAQKVEITSKTMKAEDMHKKVHFIGEAKIKQSKSWLHAERVIVYFDEHNETKKYEAIGKVKFQFDENKSLYKGSSHKVIYFPRKSEYLLIGGVKLNDLSNERQILGEKIVLDILHGRAEVKSDGVKPVKFIFEVNEKK